MRIYRGTLRGAAAPGLSWTTDPLRAVWFARWNQDNSRIRVLYGVMARGTPVVLEGLIARDQVLALLSERGEDEIVALPVAVRVERVLAWDDAAALWDPDGRVGEVENLDALLSLVRAARAASRTRGT